LTKAATAQQERPFNLGQLPFRLVLRSMLLEAPSMGLNKSALKTFHRKHLAVRRRRLRDAANSSLLKGKRFPFSRKNKSVLQKLMALRKVQQIPNSERVIQRMPDQSGKR